MSKALNVAVCQINPTLGNFQKNIDINNDITSNMDNDKTPILVVHQDSEKKYNKDIETIKTNLIKMNDYLMKHRKDRLISIILTRLWEYLYYQILDVFADINYGYCMTVHKSQGSTYDNVYVDINNILTVKIDDSQKTKCLYTAITRAANNLKLFI